MMISALSQAILAYSPMWSNEIFSLYLAMGEGANNPANAPTAAEPKAIKPSGMVAAVLMLR